MNNADLAEIRAKLQANAVPERRARSPLFGALRSLLPANGHDGRADLSPPRRVGLRASEAEQPPPEAPAPETSAHDDPAAERRRAFGQRHENVAEPSAPLLLAAPFEEGPIDEAAVAEAAEVVRRRGLRLASAMLPATETPYHPEDLDDLPGEAAAIYAECGLFEVEPATPPSSMVLSDGERTLLQRLEATFLAELAGLKAA